MNLNELKPSKQVRQKRRDKRLGEEINECGRHGGGWMKSSQNDIYRRDGGNEAARTMERMKFHHGTKSLTDNLEPLYRFLNSHVGKHWDKVYAELCQKLDKSSMQGQHVFQHLHHMVYQKVRIENGTVYGTGEWGIHPLRSYGNWADFYVHPKTGVLKKAR
ncbi:MAG: hypothetical protein H7Y12_13965 [Sphingobacteriaceae bacterium]|nr:hypothetical protein [Cytophagaceae bacterium]